MANIVLAFVQPPMKTHKHGTSSSSLSFYIIRTLTVECFRQMGLTSEIWVANPFLIYLNLVDRLYCTCSVWCVVVLMGLPGPLVPGKYDLLERLHRKDRTICIPNVPHQRYE